MLPHRFMCASLERFLALRVKAEDLIPAILDTVKHAKNNKKNNNSNTQKNSNNHPKKKQVWKPNWILARLVCWHSTQEHAKYRYRKPSTSTDNRRFGEPIFTPAYRLGARSLASYILGGSLETSVSASDFVTLHHVLVKVGKVRPRGRLMTSSADIVRFLVCVCPPLPTPPPDPHHHLTHLPHPPNPFLPSRTRRIRLINCDWKCSHSRQKGVWGFPGRDVFKNHVWCAVCTDVIGNENISRDWDYVSNNHWEITAERSYTTVRTLWVSSLFLFWLRI